MLEKTRVSIGVISQFIDSVLVRLKSSDDKKADVVEMLMEGTIVLVDTTTTLADSIAPPLCLVSFGDKEPLL